MKDLIVPSLKADPNIGPVLTAPGDEPRIWSASSLGREGDMSVSSIPAMPLKPFLIVTELATVPYVEVQETSRASAITYRVNVYDVPGDYERINAFLGLIRECVLGLPEEVSASGVRCTDVSWTGYSQELQDPEYDSNLRYASFVLTAST